MKANDVLGLTRDELSHQRAVASAKLQDLIEEAAKAIRWLHDGDVPPLGLAGQMLADARDAVSQVRVLKDTATLLAGVTG